MAEISGTSPLIAHSHSTGAASAAGEPPMSQVAGWLPPPPRQRPSLSLTLGDEVADGWHAARLVQDRPNFEYYVQSITVRRPFRVTRPWRGVRLGAAAAGLATLMPDLSTASRTLAIDWAWVPDPDGRLVLPIFIKRVGKFWLRRSRQVRARLVLKDMSIKGRDITLKVRSNNIRWTRGTSRARP